MIPLGVDHQKFNPTLNDPLLKAQAKERLGIPPGAYVFGTLSRMSTIKNLETVIEAYSHAEPILKQEGGKPILAIVGGDKKDLSNNQTVLGKLNVFAQEKGIKDIRFFGSMPGEEAYKIFDTFICASYWESFSLAVAEAMACAKSCIVSDIPTLREVTGNTQLYFDPFNHQELSQRMQEVVFSETNREEIESLAKKTSDALSWERHTKQVMEEILRLGVEKNIYSAADIREFQRKRPMTEAEEVILGSFRATRIELVKNYNKAASRVQELKEKIDMWNYGLRPEYPNPIGQFRRWELKRELKEAENKLEGAGKRMGILIDTEGAFINGDLEKPYKYLLDRLRYLESIKTRQPHYWMASPDLQETHQFIVDSLTELLVLQKRKNKRKKK